MTIISEFRRFRGDRSGATAIEYGLIAALIAVAVIAAMALLGQGLGALWSGVNVEISAAMPG